jgi:aryl-alcohol dehydrogenase-like predicted oxidoreductase/enamine deaminase RidA (YjgF/YER057c/UK114 family)
METRELAADLKISRVLTGLWQIADQERQGTAPDLKAAVAALVDYANAGCTTFDVADHYGSAEVVAGLLPIELRRMRAASGRALADVQLLTKWVPAPGPLTREQVREGVERSLSRLQVERLDLLQFHTWNYADLSYLDALGYLQELREEGKITRVGLTNFDTAHLRVVVKSGIEVVSNQVCYSLLDNRAQQSMAGFCEEHGIHLLAYGTLAGGLLSERYRGVPEPSAEELATWSKWKYQRFVQAIGGWSVLQEILQVAADVARKHGVSLANVASRYVLQQPAVAGVIVGARLGEGMHIDDNLRLFNFALDDQDLQALDKVLEQRTPLPGDCGDEYRRPPYLTASGDLGHHLESFPAAYPRRQSGPGRSYVMSGTPWEPMAGYCRAVRQGDHILVSGTTASHGNRVIGGSDASAQMHFVIDKIEAALRSLGGRLEDVVRTRVFVKNLADWRAVAEAHGKRFGAVLPTNTLVQAQLVGEELLVEVEANALVSGTAVEC